MVYSIEQIKAILAPIAKRHQISRVFLFGSYARGEATADSDVDLIVDVNGTSLNNLFALGALYGELETAFQKSVDLVTLDSLEQTPHLESEKLFRETVERERVAVYAVS